MIDPKPRGRIIEDQLGWEQLRRAKLGPCRVCGATFLPTLHHLVPAGNGGDDVPDNLAPLCGHGTKGCHGLVEAWDLGARHRLRETLTEAEVFYIVNRKSRDFLEHAYPSAVMVCGRSGKLARVVAERCEECGEPAFPTALACSYDDVDESGGLADEGENPRYSWGNPDFVRDWEREARDV